MDILHNKGLMMQGKMPLIGLGTYQLLGKECVKSVQMALDIGYRHIDTALSYKNHSEIAKAIKGFNREELFITSKFGLDIGISVEVACDLSLKELKTEYLDLMLIHWPDYKRPMEEIYTALTKVAEKGKIRWPGVSNFTEHHLQDLFDQGLKVPYNQVELHPYLTQKNLLQFCQKKGTQLISYRSFGKGALLKEPLFDEIGKPHGKTGAQVIFRWIVQQGIPVIPKAASEKHLRENFDVFDFQLTEDEMVRLDQLNRDQRFCATDWNEFNYLAC